MRFTECPIYGFTGIISGTSAQITIAQWLGSTALSAQITDQQLIISIPQTDGTLAPLTLTPGTATDYNADVAVVEARAGQLAAEAAASAEQ